MQYFTGMLTSLLIPREEGGGGREREREAMFLRQGETCGLWQFVFLYVGTDVSEKHASSFITETKSEGYPEIVILTYKTA
jgi:hypothetical protein